MVHLFFLPREDYPVMGPVLPPKRMVGGVAIACCGVTSSPARRNRTTGPPPETYSTNRLPSSSVCFRPMPRGYLARPHAGGRGLPAPGWPVCHLRTKASRAGSCRGPMSYRAVHRSMCRNRGHLGCRVRVWLWVQQSVRPQLCSSPRGRSHQR